MRPSLPTRIRSVARRSLVAARVSLGQFRLVLPRRSVGAVQGPVSPAAEMTLIHGWAWFRPADVAAVLVTIDGVVVATAQLGPPPTDVAVARPETRASTRCGWTATVDLGPFVGRTVVIGAVAASDRGSWQHLAPRRAVVGPARVGAVEIPRAGEVVEAGTRLVVAGWASHPDELTARVDIAVDGHDVGPARPLAAPRRDRALLDPSPEAPISGFEGVVTVDGRVGSTVRICVDVVGVSGDRRSLEGVDVVVGAPRRPTRPVSSAADGSHGSVDRSAAAGAERDPGARVAVFTHRLDVGGGQLYLQEFLRATLEREALPCLVVSGADGPLRHELESLGARVHVAPVPVDSSAGYEAALREIAEVVADHAPNVALVNTLGAAPGADLAERIGIPTIWVIRESYELEDWWHAAYGRASVDPDVRARIEHVLAGVAATVFEADATRDLLRGRCPAGRSFSIPHGIPLPDVDRLRRTIDRGTARDLLGVGSSEDVVLGIGTFEPRKAQAALVAAFASVADEFPRASLTLVGDNGSPYALAVRELVQRLDLGNRIRLERVTADPGLWYLAADGFVLASDVESLPRVLLEAMAYELPVVAAAVWGVPEVVADPTTGILCPPRDTGALGDALRRLLRLTPDERARLGAAGSALVRERHDPAVANRALRSLIDRLAADPAVHPAAVLAE